MAFKDKKAPQWRAGHKPRAPFKDNRSSGGKDNRGKNSPGSKRGKS